MTREEMIRHFADTYKVEPYEWHCDKPQKPNRGAFNNIVRTSRKKRGVPEMLSQYQSAYGKRKFTNKRYHGYFIGNCAYAEGEDPTCIMICDDAKIRIVKEKDIVWLL